MSQDESDSPHSLSSDADELRRFGYVQQLDRTMGGFSSFALSFSLISITTGLFAGFQFGIRQAGPALVWSWAVVVVGQFLVALVMAGLAARFPLSGYGYQWTSRLANPHYGFFVGWLLMMQFVTGFPGVCQALAGYGLDAYGGRLCSFLMSAGIADHVEADVMRVLGIPVVSWLTVAVISTIALVHLFGMRFASRINDIGVVAELAGAFLITVILLAVWAVQGDRPLSYLTERTNFYSAQPAGMAAFALSLLTGAWCLTGFEAAADLAEETVDPRRTVPRAVLLSELTSGIGGLFMLAAFVLSIPNLEQVQASSSPLLVIIESRLGSFVTPLVMAVVLVSIFACGLASMAATSRLIFSLARDNMLPCSQFLKQVHPAHQIPRNAIMLVWLLSSLVVLALERLSLITSISAVAGYLGYGGIVAATLRRSPSSESAGRTSVGWQKAVAWAALVWIVLLIGGLTVPEPEPGAGHVAAWATLTAFVAGVVLYLAYTRPRLIRGQAGPPVAIGDD